MPESLKSIVSGFRRGILNGKSPKDRCYIVCYPLQGYLSLLGYEVELVEGLFCGWHHWWLETQDGTVIDPTISQFQSESGLPKLPNVYIGPRSKWYTDDPAI